MSWRRARVAALLLLLATTPARAAEAQAGDSLLVEVELSGIGAILLVAEREEASLRLPAAPIYALAGLGTPPVPTMSLEELGEELQVEVAWAPRQLRLVLRDLHQLLPASRKRLDELRALASARAGNVIQGSYLGPFGAVTVDHRGAVLGELGYAARRAQVRASHSSLSGTAVQASVSPVTPLWLTYGRSAAGRWRLGARVAVDRGWVSADYHMGRFGIDGAAAIGPVVVYASSRDRFAITWRGAIDVQVGHAGERSAVRLSFGPIDPSPAAVPAVY